MTCRTRSGTIRPGDLYRAVMRASWLALTCCLALVPACVAEPASDVTIAPIVDGRPSPTDDAVVFLLGTGFCSGTLIAPRVVLTAKHCIISEGATETVRASAVTVGIGESFRAIRARYPVTRILTTPGPLEISTGFDPVGGANGSDIALLILRRPVTEVAPIPIRRTSPDDLVGQTLLAVGFGNTPAGTSGVRLETDAELTRTTPALLEGIQVICSGDSGGPLLVTEGGVRQVVGVASFGVFRDGAMVGTCPADADYWNRVDIQLDLIDRALRYGGECVANGAESCNGLDDDCNGQVDEGCAPVGGACTVDADCAFAPLPEGLADEDAPPPVRCVAGLCSLSCDAREPLLGCAAVEHPFTGATTALSGLYCRNDGGCAGTCVPGVPGTGTPGSACTGDADCSTLACDLGVCSTRCVGDGGTCPSSEICLADPGQCGLCVSASSRPTGRGRGEPCSSHTQCTSGVCAPGGFCSSTCTTDPPCGEGFHCDDRLCTPGPRSELGGYCSVDDDCGAGRCGHGEAGGFCGAACTAAAECPSGECVGSPGACAPELSAFGEACTLDAECETGTCRDGLCASLCSATRFCPIGTRCVREGGETVCRVPSGGGCSASPGARGAGALWLLLGAALLRRHLRRRS